MKSATRAVRDPQGSWPVSILSKPLIHFQVRNQHIALVTDPDAIKTILCSGEQAFPKWLPIYRASATRYSGPNSILAVQGLQWTEYRKAFNPQFAPDRTELLTEVSQAVATSATRPLVGLQSLFPLCNRIAIDVMWRTLMGDNAHSPTDPHIQAISDRMVAAFDRDDLAGAAISIMGLVATASGRLPGPEMAQNHPFRSLTAESSVNLSGLSEAELKDNLFALLYAGQETTALALSWTLWILGQDQDLQDKVRAEIGSVPKDALMRREGLNRLDLLTCVLKESMRLLPPALATIRTNTEAVIVAGTDLPPNTVLVVPFYALHRSTTLWQEPDVFRPSRFNAQSPEPRHPMAFIPFSSGRHICIAAKNSMFEMVAILATIIREKRFITHDAESVKLYASLALRSRQPLLVEFSSL
ncbi:cytochrome P450 [Kordiimonas aestuarii]|uniref:cytochrome P450 n=1 Tax=Kordiimonas aestuarii TaxID=1005925 RepID=UPI0021D14E08|nr:cytochrome P450 [Kordiimonas aestuarii]